MVIDKFCLHGKMNLWIFAVVFPVSLISWSLLDTILVGSILKLYWPVSKIIWPKWESRLIDLNNSTELANIGHLVAFPKNETKIYMMTEPPATTILSRYESGETVISAKSGFKRDFEVKGSYLLEFSVNSNSLATVGEIYIQLDKESDRKKKSIQKGIN